MPTSQAMYKNVSGKRLLRFPFDMPNPYCNSRNLFAAGSTLLAKLTLNSKHAIFHSTFVKVNVWLFWGFEKPQVL